MLYTERFHFFHRYEDAQSSSRILTLEARD